MKASPKPRRMTCSPGRSADRSASAELRREVEAAVPAGEGGVVAVLGGGEGADGALGEDHQVAGAVGQMDVLGAGGGTGDGGRGGAVPLDGDGGRQLGQRPAEHPVQVGALGAAGGEVVPGQRAELGEYARVGRFGVGRVARAAAGELGGPLGERGTRTYRALDGGRLVGEHRDVLGHRVHPQQPGLLVPPDPPGPGRVRVHQMDVQLPLSVPQFGRVGGDPLQQPRGTRARADDDQDGRGRAAAHRSPPIAGRASDAVAALSRRRTTVRRPHSRWSGVGGRARELPRA